MAEKINPTKKIAVIGAGASGLTSIKACKEEGFDVVCFEKTDYVGGLWRYHEDDVDGIASVMRSTIINSSKEMSAFSDFPPPKEFPNYMHNKKMVRYIEMYGERFGLFEHIRYKQEVIKVELAPSYDETGRWRITARDMKSDQLYEEEFDGVMVCTGHHVKPYRPKFPGESEFKGQIMHSHSYKKPNGFDDKKVVIVGIGNSGGDLAVELSSIADKVYLSTRRGTWIVHRVGMNGMPFDSQYIRRWWNLLFNLTPYEVTCYFAEWRMNQRFNHRLYQLEPKHRIFAQHVMVNDALPNRILSGTVTVKGNIARFTPNGVIFENEDKEYEADVVILATGYEVSFPFLSKDLCPVNDNSVELYKYVFPPHLKHKSLAIIGLAQPIGALFPISEMHARWFAAVMSNRVKLPSTEEMQKDIAEKAQMVSKRYYASPRNTLQVDWVDYMDEITSQFGAKPDLFKMFFTDPQLFYKCLFGPCFPYQYRLTGPHSWDGAREAILTAKYRIIGALDTKAKPKSSRVSSAQKSFLKCILGFIFIVIIAFILSVIF